MASIDLIKASNGAGDAVQATVTSARVIGATTLKVNDVTNFPEGQFIGTTGTIDNTGVFDPATLTVFTAHLSGADVEIDAIAPGYADLGNTNGQVLVIKPNTLWADNVADTLAVSHNTDGTLKNNIVTTAKIADSNVTTAKIADASVTAAKIDFTTLKFGNYSTTEEDTGFKWIDSKTIYKRTFTGTITQAVNTRNTTLLANGIENVIVQSGYVQEIIGGTKMVLGSAWLNTAGGIIGSSYVILDSSGNASLLSFMPSARTNTPYAVTLHYTKS